MRLAARPPEAAWEISMFLPYFPGLVGEWQVGRWANDGYEGAHLSPRLRPGERDGRDNGHGLLVSLAERGSSGCCVRQSALAWHD